MAETMDLLKNCKKAEIYDVNHTFLCEAEVTRASYENFRLVIPKLEEEVEIAEAPEQYGVIFFDAVSGLVHCDCSFEDTLNLAKGQKSLRCIIKELKAVDQRRQDLKVPAAVALEINCIRMPLGEKRPVGRIQGITRDISAGGVYIVSDCPIPEGTQIQFQFHEMAKPLQITALILRREELPPLKDGVMQFGHGCRYMEMKPQTEAGLRSYIFRKEIQLRQRRRFDDDY